MSCAAASSDQAGTEAAPYVSRQRPRPHYGARLAGVQGKLRDLGYPVGEADGKHGKVTASTIEAFQHGNGLDGDRGCWYA